MKLYLLSQEVVTGYDTYDSAVVAAESEDDARTIHPSWSVTHVTSGEWMGTYADNATTRKRGIAGNEYLNEPDSWVRFIDIDKINVRFLGETNEPRGVILASFNAG